MQAWIRRGGQVAVFVGMIFFLGSFAQAGEGEAKPARAKCDAYDLAKFIDQQIQKKLDADKLKTCPTTDDAEFLRRVYLDITGVIPSYEQAVRFLDSTDPNKRAKLIDQLLADPKYGTHMANTWAPRLFIDTSRRLPEQMLTWLEQQFNKNQPWDRMVYDILTASGRHQENGAAMFYQGNNTVADVTEATTRAFLGVQLQCAQCHNHHLNSWKRNDYWGFAAFFVKVNKYTAKRGVVREIAEGDGKRELYDPPDGYRKVPPKFLEGGEPKLEPSEPARPVLAAWLTSKDNPFFARAFVNRTWAHFFGRGLVNPVDDMIDANPPSHPELLDELTEQFKASGFDVHYLIRAICNSQAYQRSSRPSLALQASIPSEPDAPAKATLKPDAPAKATLKPDAPAKDPVELFAQMPIRSLTPRQLHDSRSLVVGRAAGNAFLKYFDTREELNSLDYHNGIPQTLMMMNSQTANSGLKAVLKQTVRSDDSTEKNLERLCLHVLSRRPTAQETMRWSELVGRHGEQGYLDLVWVWLNSAEFLLNR